MTNSDAINSDAGQCLDESLRDRRENLSDGYFVLLGLARLNAIRDGKRGETYVSDESRVSQKIAMEGLLFLVERCRGNGIERKDTDRLLPLFFAYWRQCHEEGSGLSTAAKSEETFAAIKSFVDYLCGTTNVEPNLGLFFPVSNEAP